MHRYFVNEHDGNFFYLKDDNLHHARNVVRLKINQKVVCIYNEQSFECLVEEINNETIILKKVLMIDSDEKKYSVTLIVGLIREQKWDFVLQKATELGVDRIVPAVFKRNVVKIDEKNISKKIARWQKICEDASEQSYKVKIPIIEPVLTNIKDINNYKADINLCCYENGEEQKLNSYYEKGNNFTFVIGPEGGFEEKEVRAIKELGFNIIKFSKSILRAETVPLYLLSTLLFNFE